MKVSSFFEAVFSGDRGRRRRAAVDQEISAQISSVRESTQIVSSGTRVVQAMTGAMRMMTETGSEQNNG